MIQMTVHERSAIWNSPAFITLTNSLVSSITGRYGSRIEMIRKHQSGSNRCLILLLNIRMGKSSVTLGLLTDWLSMSQLASCSSMRTRRRVGSIRGGATRLKCGTNAQAIALLQLQFSGFPFGTLGLLEIKLSPQIVAKTLCLLKCRGSLRTLCIGGTGLGTLSIFMKGTRLTLRTRQGILIRATGTLGHAH